MDCLHKGLLVKNAPRGSVFRCLTLHVVPTMCACTVHQIPGCAFDDLEPVDPPEISMDFSMRGDAPQKKPESNLDKPRQTFGKPCAGTSTSWTGRGWSVLMREGDRASRKMPMLTVVTVCDGLATARSWKGCARKGSVCTRACL